MCKGHCNWFEYFFIARDLRELYSNRLNSHNNQNILVVNIILKYNFYGLRTSVLP